MKLKMFLIAIATLAFALPVQSQDYVEYGEASYYADKLHGNRTATGEIYDKTKLTCAHKNLPTGSIIKVTRTDNNKSVRVRVNDCGPHKEGRVVDLSRAAAEKLDLVNDGIALVKIELIKKGTGKSPCGTFFDESKAKVASYEILSPTLTAKGGPQGEPSQDVKPAVPTFPNGTYKSDIINNINSGFGVQVFSFGKYDNLVGKVNELKSKGFEDILIRVDNTAKAPFRIIMGPFGSESQANSYRQNLRKKYKIKGFVTDLSN